MNSEGHDAPILLSYQDLEVVPQRRDQAPLQPRFIETTVQEAKLYPDPIYTPPQADNNGYYSQQNAQKSSRKKRKCCFILFWMVTTICLMVATAAVAVHVAHTSIHRAPQSRYARKGNKRGRKQEQKFCIVIRST